MTNAAQRRQPSHRIQIIIPGADIIGIGSARHLLEQGHEVTTVALNRRRNTIESVAVSALSIGDRCQNDANRQIDCSGSNWRPGHSAPENLIRVYP